MSAPRWEVLTRIGNHWENVWEIDEQPEFFGSYDDAWTALNEHLAECEGAVRAGHLEDAPPRSDFLIVQCGLSAAEFYRALQLLPPCEATP